jgi:dsDNA-binding SOS-regulon protein
MRSEDSTQFSIEMDVKDELDMFKARNKDVIINLFKKKKRHVTNSDAIRYLLLLEKKSRNQKKQ